LLPKTPKPHFKLIIINMKSFAFAASLLTMQAHAQTDESKAMLD